MKILWITNVPFPEICNELKIKHPISGGWMHAGASMLIETNQNIKLAVASLYNGKELLLIEKYSIKYFLIPNKGGSNVYNQLLEKYFSEIKSIFKPDVIHIHGSEYPHSLAYIKACGTKNVVVSIQGLVSIYSTYYYLGGIVEKDVRKFRSIRDLIRNDSLLQQQKRMKERGEYEIELLENVKHIIGRTNWDLSNAWALNPKAKYHFCNETLRPSFYKKRWKIENCKKYSIFLSQGHYPIKGIQQIIKALPIILQHYPETKVYVAGNDFINVSFYRRNGFARYLNYLMNKNQILKDHINFLGPLNENQMLEQFVFSHIFLCPSAIENSPNSLGEAQLVGTPCVASYTGGTMEMISDGDTGLLYRFEEIALLAKHICRIFENEEIANSLSEKAHKVAFSRHHRINNAIQLNTIYKQIVNEGIFDL